MLRYEKYNNLYNFMVKKSSNTNSILDKVMAVQKEKLKSNFNPKQIVSELLKALNEREKEVLTKRYSLKGEKKLTLESIGKKHGITRERVRQIENIAIKKAKSIAKKLNEIEDLKTSVNDLLDQYLGVLGEKTLITKVLNNEETDGPDENYHITKFLIEKLLDDQYEIKKEDNEFTTAYRKKNHNWDEFYDAIKKVIQIFEKESEPIKEEKLWDAYEKEPKINFKNNKITNDILLNYLIMSKKIEANPLGELGLTNWKSIIPKRMSDKIKLVMKNLEKPLHFRDIADEINKMNFDKKIAHPATIHNELILDDDYILVGRGIYALKKWGYEAGKVSDVVEKIIKKEGPMTKKELIDQVLEKKLVKRTTINLAIINNKNIQKNKDGKYYLSS
jgi:transcriptional regulator with XRE-family HTH domain